MTDDDRKAKDLLADAGGEELDAATRAQLERWFGLPSYEQVAEEAAARPPEDAEVVARREAQARAAAAVDPVLNEALHARGAAVDRMLRIPPLELGVLDPSISAIDPVLLARADLAEPRVVDLPRGVLDDMADPTPQALLRDLHRPELEFPLRLEIDPVLLEIARVDAAAEVRAVMSSRVTAELPVPAARAIAEDLAPMRRARREPWGELRTPGRRVAE
jgi:hypothetical protein